MEVPNHNQMMSLLWTCNEETHCGKSSWWNKSIYLMNQKTKKDHVITILVESTPSVTYGPPTGPYLLNIAPLLGSTILMTKHLTHDRFSDILLVKLVAKIKMPWLKVSGGRKLILADNPRGKVHNSRGSLTAMARAENWQITHSITDRTQIKPSRSGSKL